MKISNSSVSIDAANFSHQVQGGSVTFQNTSPYKFTEKHLLILKSLVRSNLSSLQMEDANIRVDFTSVSSLGSGTAGEAYQGVKNSQGIIGGGIVVKAKILKDVLSPDGSVDRHKLTYLAEVLAHELVHCKQHKERWLSRDKHGDTLWKGDLQDEKGRYFDDIQYRKRPWEKMAFAAEKSLGQAAIQDLIGQAIISVSEGMYVPKTDSEKASAALRMVRVAEKAERLRLGK